MNTLMHNVRFQSDFNALKRVSLNPRRHTAANAMEHSVEAARRAVELGRYNGCTAAEIDTLQTLGYVHDIGKLDGRPHPANSKARLPRYGLHDEGLAQLVKFHDVALPWYLSKRKGQAPGARAWRKLASRLDMRLLCLFTVADRVDCLGGWRANEPTVWFLAEARRRRLIDAGFPRDPEEEGAA